MTDKAKWSLVTLDQMQTYLQQADELCLLLTRAARTKGYHPITGALAGIALIRAINQSMGGDLNFWGRLLLEGPAALDDFGVQQIGGTIANVPRSGGST